MRRNGTSHWHFDHTCTLVLFGQAERHGRLLPGGLCAMKAILAALGTILIVSPAFAQQPAGAQQKTTMEMRCRTLAANETAKSNETLINGMACHAVKSDASAEAVAQNQTPDAPATQAQEGAAAPAASAPVPAPENDGKTRVYVTDSQSWETHGGSSAGGNRHGWGSTSWMSGGARPQTAEIIKTL